MPRQWEEDLPVNTQMGRKMLFLLILLMLMAGFTFFISGRIRRPRAIPADFSHLQSILEQENLYGKTQMGSEAVLKRNFGILPATCAEVLYLAPDSFMDVDELLLIRFPEPEAAEVVVAVAEVTIPLIPPEGRVMEIRHLNSREEIRYIPLKEFYYLHLLCRLLPGN